MRNSNTISKQINSWLKNHTALPAGIKYLVPIHTKVGRFQIKADIVDAFNVRFAAWIDQNGRTQLTHIKF